jgi:hypothetical protein
MRRGDKYPTSGGPARPPPNKQRPSMGSERAALCGRDDSGLDQNGQSIGNTYATLPSHVLKDRGQMVTMKTVQGVAAEQSRRSSGQTYRRGETEKNGNPACLAAPCGPTKRTGGESVTYPALSAAPRGPTGRTGKGSEVKTARSAAPRGSTERSARLYDINHAQPATRKVRPDGRGDYTQTPAARLRPPQEPPQGLRPSMVPQRTSKTGTPCAAARTVVPPNAICMRPRRIITDH